MGDHPTVHRPTAELGLLAGFLLLVATGYLDSYVFLQHGRVFAQAMTGNLVLIAIGVVAPEIIAFWLPLTAYLAFVVGVAVIWLWSQTRHSRTPPHDLAPQLTTLMLQTAVLIIVGFLPTSFPQVVIIAVIAFVSGLQIASFRKIGAAAFTTTVMTTNSMRTINATLTALTSRQPDDIATARSLLLALGGFVLGVFVGAFGSLWLSDRAAWPDAGLYLVVVMIFLLERRRDPALTGRGPAAGKLGP